MRADSIPSRNRGGWRCSLYTRLHGRQNRREEVFYLMSRAFHAKPPIQMVVEGFFDPLMQRIPFAGVRAHIAERIIEKVG